MRTATLIRPRGGAGIDLLRAAGGIVFARALNDALNLSDTALRSLSRLLRLLETFSPTDIQYLPLTPLWPDPLPSGNDGVPYTYKLTSSGGWGAKTYAQTAGTLPTGLSFSVDTISGTPAGTASFVGVTFSVSDSLL